MHSLTQIHRGSEWERAWRAFLQSAVRTIVKTTTRSSKENGRSPRSYCPFFILLSFFSDLSSLLSRIRSRASFPSSWSAWTQQYHFDTITRICRQQSTIGAQCSDDSARIRRRFESFTATICCIKMYAGWTTLRRERQEGACCNAAMIRLKPTRACEREMNREQKSQTRTPCEIGMHARNWDKRNEWKNRKWSMLLFGGFWPAPFFLSIPFLYIPHCVCLILHAFRWFVFSFSVSAISTPRDAGVSVDLVAASLSPTLTTTNSRPTTWITSPSHSTQKARSA